MEIDIYHIFTYWHTRGNNLFSHCAISFCGF